MRFRPSAAWAKTKNQTGSAQQARADATGEKSPKNILSAAAHATKSNGGKTSPPALPRETPALAPRKTGTSALRSEAPSADRTSKTGGSAGRKNSRPVAYSAQPQGLVDTIKHAADRVIPQSGQADDQARGESYIRKLSSTRSLWKRASAVQENGRLENSPIETHHRRAIGREHFKGKVRNLQVD